MRTYCIANIDCIHPFFNKMDEYAFACKNVFNKTLYEYRQNFFYQEPLLTAFDMINYLSNKKKKIMFQQKSNNKQLNKFTNQLSLQLRNQNYHVI